MKARFIAVILAISLLAACGNDTSSKDGEVSVFAAASLRDAIQQIGELYTERTGTKLVYNFAGSNELVRQITTSQKADVFLSADEKFIDQLQSAGLVADGTRTALTSNRLVVVARTDSPYRIATPADLATVPYRQLVLADPKGVPAGVYAREWLTSQPAPGGAGTLWDAVAPRVAPTADVRAALGLVESDPELIGIVYRTDAASTERVRTLYEVPKGQGPKIVYGGAAISKGPNPEGGRRFLTFLTEPDAAQIFRQRGFLPVRDG